MNRLPGFLRRLALDDGTDERAIRRAYARELKQIDPETDPAGFQSLREDYEAAMQWMRWRQEAEVEPVPADAPDTTENTGASPPLPSPSEAPTPERNEPGEPPLPPNLAAPDAAAVFTEFQAGLAATATVTGWNADKVQQRALESVLDDPRLTHIEARDIFEWHIASLLAGGWQPGHEALLVAAARVFGWNRDRRHLTRFGQVGDILDRSLDERAIYDQQPDAARIAQRDIIARLRDPAPPTRRELLGKLATAEWLLHRFPAWIPLITSMENLENWRRLDAKIPAWRRRLAGRSSQQSRQKPAPLPSPILRWVLILSAISMLRLCVDTPAGTSSGYSSSQYGNTSVMAGYAARQTASAANATPIDGLLALSPEERLRVVSIVDGAPTWEKCRAAAELTDRYGDSAARTRFGSAFRRQIASCITVGMWPHKIRLSPATLQAMRQERNRQAAKQKKAPAKLAIKGAPSRVADTHAAAPATMTDVAPPTFRRIRPRPDPSSADVSRLAAERPWPLKPAETKDSSIVNIFRPPPEQPWILKPAKEKYRLEHADKLPNSEP